MEFDQSAIQHILPHRPPFLFIDRVIDVVPGTSGTGIKRLSAGELLLAHNRMALPDILHLEIMAQTTAIICAAAATADPAIDTGALPSAAMGYLAGGDLQFNQPGSALAGQTLEAQVTITKSWGPFILAQGAIVCNGQELANGRFTIARAAQ